jgi:hypothetical protein
VKAAPALLRELVVGDFPPYIMDVSFAQTGDLARLFRVLPSLERLSVRGGARLDASVEHETLNELCIVAPRLTSPTISRLMKARAPALESLEVSGAALEIEAKAIAALLADGLPKLRRLAFDKSVGTIALLEAIVASPRFGAIDVLELTDGDLDDATIPRLMARAPAFAHLRRLNLRGSRFSEAGAKHLLGLAPNVDATPREEHFGLTDAAVVARAPDAQSVTAARALAKPDEWLMLGREGERVWGEIEGRDHYYVLARLDTEEASCGCASPKNPCKHVLALLFLAAAQHRFVERAMPYELGRQSRERPRYAPTWE